MPDQPAALPRLLISAAGLAVLLVTGASGCDREPSGSLSRGPRALPSTLTSSAQRGDPELGADACSFDWVSLDEAFRSCATFPMEEKSTQPPRKLRVPREPLSVPSGESLSFSVGVGQREGTKGPWTLDLDDRCGTAMRPMLVDAEGRLLDDLALLPPPACPGSRARVTLSGRGQVSARLTIKAVKRTVERVVVGHRTLPGGRVENVVENREKEAPLPPGKYGIEIALPTSDGATEVVPLEVTKAPVAPPKGPGGASKPRP